MIVATAGHVDHGKTALVKALTGVDTDRLAEEKARGISIEVGFAYLDTPSGRTLGFVDVPGHERFVRNMLAGVCAIDFVVLVVAADDGVMPQTREHLAIVDLLGVREGVVVITKADAVTPARIAEVIEEARALVAATALRDADVVTTSARTGEGIEALRARLLARAEAWHRASLPGRNARLAIDRVFTVAGSGTIVTGAVSQGRFQVGDRVVLSPGGVEARIRTLQKAGRTADAAHAGERCALNLAGVERGEAQRGQWVVARAAPTTRLDVDLALLATVPRALPHRACVHLHVGTADVVARVAIPRGAALSPGTRGRVQLVCEAPVDVVVGERFIVRDPSALHTLGGGVVIDPAAPARRTRADSRAIALDALATLAPDTALRALLGALPAGVDAERFARQFDLSPAGVSELLARASAVALGRDAPRAFTSERLDAIKNAIVVTLARFHEQSPQAPGLEEERLRRATAPALAPEVFAALLRACAVELKLDIAGAIVRRTSHVATANRADEHLWQRVKPRLLEAGFRGGRVRELAVDLDVREPVLADFLHRKAATGEVVAATRERFYPREVLAQLAAIATSMERERGDEGFLAAEFRDRTALNRTIAIEVLECLDRLGITQRVGDARRIRNDFVPILGPARAPTVARAARGPHAAHHA